jgi:tetratricopeptide (TPR) repeat protein
MSTGNSRRIISREINRALSHWDISEMPPCASTVWPLRRKAESELALSNWLYDLVRRNVKRGRVFEVRDVLIQRQADCLGYAKLMTCLGRRFALEIGIIEVVIDNAGRRLPHYINIVRLSSGGTRFMDLWYGSKNITHLRIGAWVKERGKWRVKDLDWNELESLEDIKGLPLSLVDGITHYIMGNRHLEKGIRETNREELDRAIAEYDKAISLYPGYARAYFNKAIAYENKGERGKASSDYAWALRDEASQIRVLAREHEDVIRLMELDRTRIEAREQEIYLLRKGFITGEAVASTDVASRYRISESEAGRVISTIERELIAASINA